MEMSVSAMPIHFYQLDPEDDSKKDFAFDKKDSYCYYVFEDQFKKIVCLTSI